MSRNAMKSANAIKSRLFRMANVMKNCISCGAEMSENWSVCPRCGKNQNEGSKTASGDGTFRQNPNYIDKSPEGKGMCVASMVLGICSIVTPIIPFGGLILGIIGLFLGVVGKKKLTMNDSQARPDKSASGMATAGIVTSIIGMSLSALVWLTCIACAAIYSTTMNPFSMSPFWWNF